MCFLFLKLLKTDIKSISFKKYKINFLFLVLQNQLEECLQSLEREREEKISLRRELADVTDREHLPRTPSRNAQSVDPANIPCPASPDSSGDVSILQAQTLKDRIRKLIKKIQ